MFRSIQTYVILSLTVGVLLLGYLYKESLKEVGELTLAKEQAELQLRETVKKLEEQSKRLTSLTSERSKTQTEFRKAKSELDSLKSRQNVVKAKPALVERKIQSSFDEFLNGMQCDTGATEKC